MNKVVELLLTGLALAALYSAIPTTASRPAASALRADQTVMVADGTDPMPLCRARRCTQ